MSVNPISDDALPETVLSDSDLEWLAFQYAGGELPSVECAAFERLLATDERACAALARAVTLGQTVLLCELAGSESTCAAAVPCSREGAASVVKSSRVSRHWVLAAATVACGLVAVGWLSVQGSRTAAARAEVSSTVASLWIAGGEEDAAVDPDLLSDQPSAELSEDEAVPGWLLAALNEKQREDGDALMND